MKVKQSFGGNPIFYKKSKYGNRKIVHNGKTYDSKKEFSHAQYLEMLLRADKILAFIHHPEPIELIPAQPDFGLRSLKYCPDFLITHLDGSKEYQDVKGFLTEEFKIKQKILAWRHKIKITIV